MYKEFLSRLPLPKTEYYQLIVEHRKEILQDALDYGQVKVAKDLGMSQGRLSAILNVLRVIND